MRLGSHIPSSARAATAASASDRASKTFLIIALRNISTVSIRKNRQKVTNTPYISLLKPHPSRHPRRDTAQLRRWYIRSEWKLGGEYTLTIPQGAITDIAGFSNDSIVGKYTVFDPEQFATVKIHVAGRNDGSKYIIQLLDANNALQQEKRDITSGDVQFNYVPAGEIKFRVIEDRNGNGRWDTGNLVERRQPERAEIYKDPAGEETFATKTNWEIEFTMDMNRIFAPVTMKSLVRLLDERETQRQQREAEKRAKELLKGDSRRQGQQQTTNANFGSAGNMFSTFR